MDAATKYNDNKRCMSVCDHIDEFLLDTSEIEAGSVVALAGSCWTHHTATSCDHNHSNISIARRIYGFREVGAVVSLHCTASGILHFHAVS